ncbi:SDR family NAD(P)-dependent oxidoreductase [Horticoccus sp. 23ND18S-11]|uniref:SDR family NAD(P)-dependent oxidoreductase n=1 Tax=Horticoccus sp. 23ND18S-11 TaxID=3391832 RepID=UPI0039C8EA4A
MSKLLGKRVLITAGAQGIGLAISRHLLRAGCDLFVHYHRSSEAAEALGQEAAALARRCAFSSGDLTRTEDCDRIVAEAVGCLGGLDILINNAGSLIARRGFTEADDAFWAQTISLNVGSTRKVTRAAVPHLVASARAAGGASIVNLASLAGRKGGHAGSIAYSTAKGAILTFTRALATELGPQGIRVNALAPGLILGTSFHNTHTSPESARATVAGIPLGRGGNADDVARAAVYLASEFDGFITGATLDINGGVYSC